MIAAQNLDCLIVYIIWGSTDAVELQWNINYGEHGQDYLRLHSKAVIENRFQPQIKYQYDGTLWIVVITTISQKNLGTNINKNKVDN